jgi:diguanylate cyclase (GGDEF)-like protein/PAS domain S-box-containing protein
MVDRDQQRNSYVGRNRVRYLYDQGKFAVLGNLGVGAVLAFALSDVVTRASLVTWILALLLGSLVRSIVAVAYYRQPKGERRREIWRYATIIGSMIMGCVWGLTGVLFAPQVSAEYLLLICFALGGVTLAAIPLLAPLLSAFLAFMLTSSTPMTLWLLGSGNEVYFSMAMLALVYAVVMVGLAVHFQRSTVRALKLGFEKSDLVKRVSRAKEKTEAANLQLEDEIQERLEVEAALRKSEARFRSAFDDAPIAMALLDSEGRFFELNRIFEAMLGYDPSKLNGSLFKDITHPDDVEMSLQKYRSMINGDVDHYQIEKRFRHKDGKTIWGLLSVSVVRDSGDAPIHAISQIQDVTESHAMSERLSYQASHDALTGLVNRREFERRVETAINASAEEACEHALCYLDLDQFKIINDSCGHVAGDALLKQLGSILKTKVRRSDTIARLGGDEFGILIERCPSDEAREIADAVLDAVRNFRFSWEDKTFSIGASVGLVPITSGEETVTDLLRLADSGCYAAKDHGRNRIYVCEPGDLEVARMQGEMQWVGRINNALEHGSMRLAFQPIAPVSMMIQNGSHHGELLLRIVNEDEPDKFHPLGAFLSAAERYDMASRIDRWVVGTAFDWFKRHPGKLDSLNFCSINLSGQSLVNEDLLDYLTSLFKQGDIPANKVCFEITETAAIANLSDAVKFFESLRSLGCLFALDDFGSGMSSYAYLKTLPVDFLKIDGVFIRDIAKDPINRAMVQSINEIGQVMGKKTIAEFVEDDEILKVLRQIGVDYAQGYGIGRPRLLDDLGEVDFSARAA